MVFKLELYLSHHHSISIMRTVTNVLFVVPKKMEKHRNIKPTSRRNETTCFCQKKNYPLPGIWFWMVFSLIDCYACANKIYLKQQIRMIVCTH